jgi:methyl-accepting chemotaxis protein
MRAAFLLLSLTAAAAPRGEAPPAARVAGLGDIVTWHYLAGDDAAYARPDFDDRSWGTATLPAQAMQFGAERGYLWLRARFALPAEARGSHLAVLVPNVMSACELYLNGSHVASLGEMPPAYSGTTNGAHDFLLPSGLLRWEGENLLAVRFYSDDAGFPIAAPFSVDRYERQHRRAAFISLLNSEVPTVFAGVGLVLAAVYLLQYARRRSERIYLYFGSSCFASSLYFLEMVANANLIRSPLWIAVTKGGFAVYASAMLLTIVEYFDLHNSRRLKQVVTLIGAVLLLAILSAAHSIGAVLQRFGMLLLPIMLVFFFAIYVIIRATLQRRRDSMPVFVGSIVAIILGGYDAAHMISGNIPVAWLHSGALFAVALSVHFSLSLRAARAQAELVRTSEENAEKSRQLQALLDRTTTMSRLVSETTASLDDTMQAVARSVEPLTAQTQRIADAVASQYQFIVHVEDSLTRLGSGVDTNVRSAAELSHSLERALEEVGRIDGTAQQAHQAIEATSLSTSRIAQHAGTLAERTHHSDESVRQLQQAVTRIAELVEQARRNSVAVGNHASSGQDAVLTTLNGIRDIAGAFASIEAAVATLGSRIDVVARAVAVIEDVSRQTRLLSLNAGILSAQAGEQGASFAVVASEIKSLSDRTSHSTGEIAEMLVSLHEARERVASAIATGIARVQLGEQLADQANQAMAAILTVMQETGKHLEAVSEGTRSHVRGASAIGEATAEIAGMGKSINDVTAAQRQETERTRAQVAEISKAVGSIRSSLAGQTAASSQAVELARKVRLMAEEVHTTSLQLQVSGEAIVRDVRAIHDASRAASQRTLHVQEVLRSLGTQVVALKGERSRPPTA